MEHVKLGEPVEGVRCPDPACRRQLYPTPPFIADDFHYLVGLHCPGNGKSPRRIIRIEVPPDEQWENIRPEEIQRLIDANFAKNGYTPPITYVFHARPIVDELARLDDKA